MHLIVKTAEKTQKMFACGVYFSLLYFKNMRYKINWGGNPTQEAKVRKSCKFLYLHEILSSL